MAVNILPYEQTDNDFFKQLLLICVDRCLSKQVSPTISSTIQPHSSTFWQPSTNGRPAPPPSQCPCRRPTVTRNGVKLPRQCAPLAPNLCAPATLPAVAIAASRRARWWSRASRSTRQPSTRSPRPRPRRSRCRRRLALCRRPVHRRLRYDALPPAIVFKLHRYVNFQFFSRFEFQYVFYIYCLRNSLIILKIFLNEHWTLHWQI